MKAKNGKKYCPDCGPVAGEKPLADFNRCWGSNDGYQVYCRACHRVRIRAHEKARRERNRERNERRAGVKAGGES